MAERTVFKPRIQLAQFVSLLISLGCCVYLALFLAYISVIFKHIGSHWFFVFVFCVGGLVN